MKYQGREILRIIQGHQSQGCLILAALLARTKSFLIDDSTIRCMRKDLGSDGELAEVSQVGRCLCLPGQSLCIIHSPEIMYNLLFMTFKQVAYYYWPVERRFPPFPPPPKSRAPGEALTFPDPSRRKPSLPSKSLTGDPG